MATVGPTAAPGAMDTRAPPEVAPMLPSPERGCHGARTRRMPEGKDRPIVARAKIVATKRQAAANHRVSFAFERLPESDTERLSILVFDTVLSRLGGK